MLGFYDLTKKAAVHGNAVPIVLLLNVATAALIYAPVLWLSRYATETLEGTPLLIPSLSGTEHLALACKSVLVGASWTLAMFGLKHLPISIATPIRATSPLWTILTAVLFFGERPQPVQWIGIATILIAFFFFSLVSASEGIQFRKNRWVACMFVATLLGSLSALYDKYLLQTMKLSAVAVQAWFSIYLVPVMMPLAIHWYRNQRQVQPFEFRITIPLIAVTILVADFLYFTAVSDPDALIAIISPVRRTSVIIPFVFGILWLSEQNWKNKALCIALMLFGVFLVSAG